MLLTDESESTFNDLKDEVIDKKFQYTIRSEIRWMEGETVDFTEGNQ